jgi:beta-glucanase (GH16 family)
MVNPPSPIFPCFYAVHPLTRRVDLDEVDVEIMGGNTTHVESNYFGKGNHTTYDRAIYHPVDNPQGDFHNYTVVWTADQLQWIFDGTVVRTLLPADAVDGKNYPQTPMTIRIGIWAGGDASEPPDTIAWAGGPTDYSKGPFDMSLKSIRATDYSRGTAYQYADKSGTWESIKAIE